MFSLQISSLEYPCLLLILNVVALGSLSWGEFLLILKKCECSMFMNSYKCDTSYSADS